MTHFRKDPLSYRPGDEVAARYRITGILGKGGFGAVYAAEHTGTQQRVAVKMLTVDPEETDDDIVKRFVREARITAQLKSYNTVRVFDVGQDDDGPFFMAMEMLKGPDLYKVLKKHRKAGRVVAEKQAVTIALQILKSLGEAHRAGLVHRDLKPANVILADMGEDEPVVKVLDFGIARTEDSSLTAQGKALGTPAYMSPEQCKGQELDGRSDLYALGCILYECLTGHRPYEARESWALMQMHLAEPPPDPRQRQPKVGAGVAACVLKAMAKDREQRFTDAKEMRHALQSALGGAWALTPATPLEAAEVETVALDAVPASKTNVPPILPVDVSDAPPTLPVDATPSGLQTVDTDGSLSALMQVDGEDLMEEATLALEVAQAAVGASSSDISVPRSGASRSAHSAAVAPAHPESGSGGGGLKIAIAAAVVLAVAGGGYALLGGGDKAPPAMTVSAAEGKALAPKPGDSAARDQEPAKAAPAELQVDVKKVEAEAKAELARSASDLAKKVGYMKEAVTLDPSNAKYPILLKAYEKALADSEAAAAAEAAEKAAAQAKATAKPAAKKRKMPTRSAAPVTKPAKKATPKPRPSTDDGGLEIEAVD